MTVLEFVSHVNERNRLSIRNLDSKFEAHCNVGEIEKAEYKYWHECKVEDWYCSADGKFFMEVRDV